MPGGICKLCLITKPLQDSHLIPKAMYPPDAIVINRSVSVQGDRQVKQHLLCAHCEDLFNKNGEKYVISQCDNGQQFKLLERLNLCSPLRDNGRFATFSGSAIGVDTEKLAYFALSVMWRASVATWNLYGQTTHIDLGAYEEPMRRFLLGESGFPNELIVVVTVCTDWFSQGNVLFPSVVPVNPVRTWSMLTRGIFFRVSAEAGVVGKLGSACCHSSPQRLIFREDMKDRTNVAFGYLQKTSRPSKRLRRDFPSRKNPLGE